MAPNEFLTLLLSSVQEENRLNGSGNDGLTKFGGKYFSRVILDEQK